VIVQENFKLKVIRRSFVNKYEELIVWEKEKQDEERENYKPGFTVFNSCFIFTNYCAKSIENIN